MSLDKLENIFQHFGEPFLEKGLARTERSDRGTLKIYIGRRDVEVDENMNVVGAGTCLLEREGVT